MGNILPANGIIDPGYPVNKVCVQCLHAFVTNEGVVTDKGSIKASDMCPSCHRAQIERYIAGGRS